MNNKYLEQSTVDSLKTISENLGRMAAACRAASKSLAESAEKILRTTRKMENKS